MITQASNMRGGRQKYWNGERDRDTENRNIYIERDPGKETSNEKFRYNQKQATMFDKPCGFGALCVSSKPRNLNCIKI